MRKSYKETSLFKVVAGITASGLLSLSISTTAFAFDTSYDGSNPDGQTFGLSLNGDLNFNNFSVAGFAHKPLSNYSGSSSNADEFFSIENGVSKTSIPLMTFGEGVKYPGLLYNNSGTQFYQHVANAVDGDETSEKVIWPYVVGGVVVVGGIVALIASNSSSDDDDPVSTTTTTTPTTSTSSSSTTTTTPTTTTTTTPAGGSTGLD